MANSYVEYTTALNSGTGTNGLGQKTFTVPTNFININDIVAKGYNGSAWTELTIASRGTTTVELSVVPTGYATVRFFRRSSTEPLVDFQTGATLSETDLDTAYRQGLFVAQEVAEDADPEGGSGVGNISNSQLAGGITQDKLAGGITDSQLASGVGTSANNLVKLDANAKLPAVDGSQLTGVGDANSVIETWYYHTTDIAEGDGSTLDQTWYRKTNLGTANKNGGMSASSGIWTFPSTGIWQTTLILNFYRNGSHPSRGVNLRYTADNGTYTDVLRPYASFYTSSANSSIILPWTFNITDTANQKIKYSIYGDGITVRGGNDHASTILQFIKLCPSV